MSSVASQDTEGDADFEEVVHFEEDTDFEGEAGSEGEANFEGELDLKGRLEDIVLNARDFPPWFKQKIDLWEIPPFPLNQSQRISSTLGILDKLPNEVLEMITKHLDFVSLSRLPEVSLRGRSLIRGLPAYRDLVKHANKVLFVLAETEALSYHSLGKIHATLRSEECASCGDPGEFVNLLTFTRACHWCVQHNYKTWLLPRFVVAKFFELELSDIETLPSCMPILRICRDEEDLHGDDQEYYEDAKVLLKQRFDTCFHILQQWAQDSFRVVSVAAAKELADRIHGPENYSRGRFESQKLILEDPMQYPDAYPTCCIDDSLPDLFLNIAGSIMFGVDHPYWDEGPPWSEFYGLGTVPLPYLSPSGTVEPRFYCGGCYWTFYQKHVRITSGEASPQGGSTISRLMERMKLAIAKDHARNGEEFINHIQVCRGAQELLLASTVEWNDYCSHMDSW